MIIVLVIITKRKNRVPQLRICVKICLEHVSSEMVHNQAINITKCAKQNYCITACLNLNEISIYN